jgi:hypothetical protein
MRRRFSIWRIISWLFWAAFCLTLGADTVRSLKLGGYTTYTTGEVFSGLAPAGSAAAKTELQPLLWEPISQIMLQFPLIFVLLVPALIFSIIARLRRRKAYQYGGSALTL